ncbi:hypothetical protein E2C01_043021 [Portunus trituberculatus]|uniref:Uncharacterized protein n=1 Tax=Portunus trituberculatus TaxID=210409 RepID=A0A5B7FUK0_PORTR|nr:hypothetical protein [Portunus trituberculatus]
MSRAASPHQIFYEARCLTIPMPHDTRHPAIARCRGAMAGGQSWRVPGGQAGSRAGLLPLRNESCNEGDVTVPH